MTFSTSTAGYVGTLTAGGTNFGNVTQVRFTWSGATSGAATWNRGDAMQWGALYSELVPHYNAVWESYNKAQEAAKQAKK